MRNVLIGCGVVVLLGLIGLGYLTYRFYPNVQKLHAEWTAAIEELNALDRQHPFDAQAQAHLDAARFEQMLDVRTALGDYFTGLDQEIQALQQAKAEEEGFTAISTVQEVLDRFAPVPRQVATHLASAKMGPQEFAWHTRVLWAALKRVDNGLGGTELEPLRGEYKRFAELYEQLRRREKGLQSLDSLLDDLPPDVLVEAGSILARDLARVRQALVVTGVDHLYMQPLQRVEDLERMKPLEAPVAP